MAKPRSAGAVFAFFQHLTSTPTFHNAAAEPSLAFCIYAPDETTESIMLRGGLLWLLGIPIPALIILWLLGYL